MFDFSQMAKAIEKQNGGSDNKQSDVDKYATAVRAAKQQLVGQGTYSDQDFKQKIDDNYKALNGRGTGSDIRSGGNGFYKAVAGLKDVLDGVDHGIGNGVDAAWNFAAGGLGDLYDMTIGGGKSHVGDGARNLMNGNDIAPVANAATTSLVSLIPYVGPALAAGKEAIQNSDNIYEAATGMNSITGEKLDDKQVLARKIEVPLSIGLAALPGVGGALSKAGAKTAEKAVPAAAEAVEKTAVKALPPAALPPAAEAVGKTVEKTGEQAAEKALAKEATEQAAKAVDDNVADAVKAGEQAAEASEKAAATGDTVDLKNAQQLKDAQDTIEDAAEQKAAGFLDNVKNSLAETKGKWDKVTHKEQRDAIEARAREIGLLNNGSKITDGITQAIPKSKAAYAKSMAKSAEKHPDHGGRNLAKALGAGGATTVGQLLKAGAGAGGRAAEALGGAWLQDMHNNGEEGHANILAALSGQTDQHDVEQIVKNILAQYIPGRRAVPRMVATAKGAKPNVGQWAVPQLSSTYPNDNVQINEDDIRDQDNVLNMSEGQYLALISALNGEK